MWIATIAFVADLHFGHIPSEQNVQNASVIGRSVYGTTTRMGPQEGCYSLGRAFNLHGAPFATIEIAVHFVRMFSHCDLNQLRVRPVALLLHTDA